ncbi:replication initiation protein [Bacillus sp. V3B]|uniref:replication initiation protein n=1 Tax=Bacillus sp. V3B TaxID=2804915 RepID=UPI00210DE308|nr:replication initiation protein [Bacillus sp. V3B]MCQ6275428.1 replication initiation protein [Bacillus sp. V3B]
MRKNLKEKNINAENSIKKSNELSMAKLNHGLRLNQMQLLAFAIFCTQKNGVTEFHKVDFEKQFGLTKYNTIDAKKDSDKVTSVKVSTEDLENEKFRFWNVFLGVEYDNGKFTFEWSPKMLPHILELKEKYVSIDLTVTAKFKSGFSWILYDYLKAHYGYWHKPISKEGLMNLFGVDEKKTYQQNTGEFKRGVLDVAISEINEHTELEVRYKEEKRGRAIVGFDLIWSNGKTVKSATKKQIKELGAILDVVFEDIFKFVNLRDDDNRQQAINMVKKMEEMKGNIEEPICITYEQADALLQQARWHLIELNRLLEEDGKPKLPFYDWLED